MQAQAIQTQVVTLSVLVSGGEFITTTYPSGKVKFWFNTHPLSKAEARRIWELKKPS